jgi:pimeloyl-ACP methyl ester carboxylesterase
MKSVIDKLWRGTLLAMCLILHSPCQSAAANQEEEFSLRSADNKAFINGSIALPPNRDGSKLVPVLFVGGSMTSRDGTAYILSGGQPKGSRFWYAKLATEMVDSGVAVIRYDNRGLGSQATCPPADDAGASPYRLALAAGSRCYDWSAALSTSFASKRADLASVLSMLARDERLDMARLIIVGHSEASHHIAYLLAHSQVRPFGLVLLSAPLSSPRDIFHWQCSGRGMAWLDSAVQAHGGYVPNALIAKKFYQGRNDAGARAVSYLSDSGGWHATQLPALGRTLRSRCDDMIRQHEQDPPNAVAFMTINANREGAAVHSAAQELSMLADRNRAIDNLANFHGPTILIYGSQDALLPVAPQLSLLRSSALAAHGAEVIVIPSTDHNFAGGDGVVAQVTLRKIAAELTRLARRAPAAMAVSRRSQ